ncbi:MAG: ATP-binding protein, partial [Actinobacteria bacterium]|nr:ATP-binding protein [Actinomycetota bacterium]
MSDFIGKRLEAAGAEQTQLEVRLSRELVSLLSEQLYTSPLKAIEELVVNAFDADAAICRVRLPEVLEAAANEPILVYDDGIGMDVAGLEDLWHIGHSSKRDAAIERQRKRKQIGKFGIGKLATYAVAEHITYITKTAGGPILSATLDYDAFKPDPSGGADAVLLAVVELDSARWASDEELLTALNAEDLDPAALADDDAHWTIVLLERFKPKIAELARGRLKWVLSTAMPLQSGFNLFLDGEEVQSSKEAYEHVVSFSVADLPKSRLETLKNKTKETWRIDGQTLKAESFPQGVTGTVIVTRRTLTDSKSADLRRSHGFFIRVRDRLVNIEDPLFGLKPLSHQTFNRFRA